MRRIKPLITRSPTLGHSNIQDLKENYIICIYRWKGLDFKKEDQITKRPMNPEPAWYQYHVERTAKQWGILGDLQVRINMSPLKAQKSILQLVWWYMSILSSPGRMTQENLEFQNDLGNRVRQVSKNNNNKRRKEKKKPAIKFENKGNHHERPCTSQ